MRILLVEDDAQLADSVARALRAEHFAVDIAANGEDGGHLGATTPYDAAVLDLGLPDRRRHFGAARVAGGGPDPAGADPHRARRLAARRWRASRPAPTIIWSSPSASRN